MNIKDYPLAQELIIDNQGHIQQVILNFEDYQQMIETYEDTGLYRAMIAVKDETPLSLEEALLELEKEWKPIIFLLLLKGDDNAYRKILPYSLQPDREYHWLNNAIAKQ